MAGSRCVVGMVGEYGIAFERLVAEGVARSSLAFTPLHLAAADLAQALRVSELAKQHHNELLPIAETAGMALGLMLSDQGLELETREELQKLAENAGYSIHGGDLLVGGTQFLAET